MINVLERITELREKRHWSEYQLAERSGLTQSTISSWYRKGMLPTIPSLSKICDAFGITMAQFFLDETEYPAIVLTEQQMTLIAATSKLNEEQYDALLHFIQTL